MSHAATFLLLLCGSHAAAAPTVTKQFEDLFTTPQATPLTSPRTAEPTGTAVIVDASGIQSISGGNYVFNGTPAAESYYRTNTPWAHLAGRVFEWKGADGTSPRSFFSLNTANNSAGTLYQMDKTNATRIDWRDNSTAFSSTAPPALPTSYSMRMIARQNGGYFYVVGTNLWYVTAGRTAPTTYMYMSASAGSAHNYTMDSFSIYDVPSGGLVTEYGLATARDAAPANNTVIASEADCLVDLTWTPQANEVLDIQFRRTDDNNCFIMRCDQANSTIQLFQKTTGSEVSKAGPVAKTWTVGTPVRLHWMVIGAVICMPTTPSAVAFASATFQQTATGVKVASNNGTPTLANLIAWRSVLTGFPFV